MTRDEAMALIEAEGEEAIRARNARNGIASQQAGVKMGTLRRIAKQAETDPELAEALWATGHFEARMVAILVMKPAKLTLGDLDRLVRSNRVTQVADWLMSYVVKKHPEREALRQGWMDAADPMAARAGWSLTWARVETTPEGLDLSALLDRIEAEMPGAAPEVQWTMNGCLAAIGIHHAGHRARALAMGEAMGIYRDYPTPKGCTSPFAPLWIAEMVRRQE